LLERGFGIELERFAQTLGMELEYALVQRTGRLSVKRPQSGGKPSLRKFACQTDFEAGKALDSKGPAKPDNGSYAGPRPLAHVGY
jgi:hypothetical protein